MKIQTYTFGFIAFKTEQFDRYLNLNYYWGLNYLPIAAVVKILSFMWIYLSLLSEPEPLRQKLQKSHNCEGPIPVESDKKTTSHKMAFQFPFQTSKNTS